MAATILVIDDDAQLLRAVRTGLEANGYNVVTAANGEEGLRVAALAQPEVVLLDLVMAGMDGVEFCRHYRIWSQVPIIVLSVQSQEDVKIAALDLGADDFLTKPFGFGELLARIRSHQRRYRAGEINCAAPRRVEDLEIDLGARMVKRAGAIIHLTPTEFDLLAYLINHQGRVLTHGLLLNAVWGPGREDLLPSMRVMITQLRKKIEPDPARPRLIVTEPGVGYRFQADDRALPARLPADTALATGESVAGS